MAKIKKTNKNLVFVRLKKLEKEVKDIKKSIKIIKDKIDFTNEDNTISDVIRNKKGETIGYKNERPMKKA